MIPVARLRRAVGRAALGVDVAAALDLVGALLKYLGAAFLVPAAVAVGYGEPFCPISEAGPGTPARGGCVRQGAAGGKRVSPGARFLLAWRS